MAKIERVKEAGESILQVIKDEPGGCKNDKALARITQLADDAVWNSEYDGYISGKASSIKSYAAVLYSARKHRKFDDRFPNGADKVRSIIASEARALTHWPLMIEGMKRGME